MKEYLPRIIDSVLDEKRTYAGGIYIKGPKWVGKTTRFIRFPTELF